MGKIGIQVVLSVFLGVWLGSVNAGYFASILCLEPKH
jgi:hypothetical protein